jgi:hypothetical protein
MSTKTGDTRTPEQQISEQARELRATHGKIGVIEIEGGAAFFRGPTPEQYDEHVSLADSSEKHKSFARYVRGCYLGAIIDRVWQGPESLPEVCRREGAAWLAGAAGATVNTLSGAKGRAPARFF